MPTLAGCSLLHGLVELACLLHPVSEYALDCPCSDLCGLSLAVLAVHDVLPPTCEPLYLTSLLLPSRSSWLGSPVNLAKTSLALDVVWTSVDVCTTLAGVVQLGQGSSLVVRW